MTSERSTCRDCRYYVTESRALQCLKAPPHPLLEDEKLKRGLIGECADFAWLESQGIVSTENSK